MVEILGVPFDLCGYRPGSRLGPAAIRLAGLAQMLEEVGISVTDGGNAPEVDESTEPGGIKNFLPALSTYRWLMGETERVCRSGNVALCLGGDHSLAIGSIAGALRVYGEKLGVLWIDAHTDLNTPDTSPSGNLHGMVLGALLGQRGDMARLDRRFDRAVVEREWSQLLSAVAGNGPLLSQNVGWLAVRDVDSGEKERLLAIEGEYVSTMFDIDREGLVECVLKADRWLMGAKVEKLWISFDVDSLDPFLAPGTGTAVRGGLTYREMHLIGEMFNELLSRADCPYSLAGIDLVETNPLFDTNNQTAKMAVEWIASVFGKTILGKR